MPKKKAHKTTDTGRADPLVPVSGSHLRAALEHCRAWDSHGHPLRVEIL